MFFFRLRYYQARLLIRLLHIWTTIEGRRKRNKHTKYSKINKSMAQSNLCVTKCWIKTTTNHIDTWTFAIACMEMFDLYRGLNHVEWNGEQCFYRIPCGTSGIWPTTAAATVSVLAIRDFGAPVTYFYFYKLSSSWFTLFLGFIALKQLNCPNEMNREKKPFCTSILSFAQILFPSIRFICFLQSFLLLIVFFVVPPKIKDASIVIISSFHVFSIGFP